MFWRCGLVYQPSPSVELLTYTSTHDFLTLIKQRKVAQLKKQHWTFSKILNVNWNQLIQLSLAARHEVKWLAKTIPPLPALNMVPRTPPWPTWPSCLETLLGMSGDVYLVFIRSHLNAWQARELLQLNILTF